MHKSKKIAESFGCNNISADERFDEWSQEHPNVSIIGFEYQQDISGDNSICILKELKSSSNEIQK